ncbi:hypothetical protein [Lentzea jiangxiensis]|uniref:HEAT repeat-containing protein n=1 Tax=Lentzea jiangxiensis TaxID=641025 RepID=A0A1H0H0D9_9PSEU|nr:hypothetical protein [Lentzea jiangxiensis]SDO12522.1 hypothetical protein SAMN05421507_1011445 [Lentzea jiangxiensis]
MNVDVALAGLLDWKSPRHLEHVRALVESEEPGADGLIEAFLGQHDASMQVTSVLCRVLAERDRDRDPSYVLKFFGKGRKGDPADWPLRRNPYRSPMSSAYGIPRLRRLKPVENLAPGLKSWSAHRRSISVLGLGDTGEPAAAALLAGRLADRHPKIRIAVASSVRRLDRQGALPAESLGPLGDGLVSCLSHREEAVVRNAAAALALPALRERLVEVSRAGELSPVAQSAVDDALKGDVVPLNQIWPGEVV